MRTSPTRGICAATGAVGLTAAFTIFGSSAIAASSDSLATFLTSIVEFAKPVETTEYEVQALLSVGDAVPNTSEPWKQYQMVGIPDGLGAHRSKSGTVTVYMSHELGNTVVSEPNVGGALNRGAFVSKYLLGRDGGVVSGERAYDHVFVRDVYIGPAAEVGNSTPGFGRFCAGFLAGREQGFDRYIYFANEETGAGSTFSPRGGYSVAIFDNEAHGLPDLGYFPWENTLVQSNTGRWTVIMGMEDGPANLNPAAENSQLYMYVGEKSRKKNATVLERNGLVGGTLYVFRAKDPAMNSELPFQRGTIAGEWVAIPGAGSMTQAQTEAASDAVAAMTFGRPEDGAFNPRNSNEFFFVTTGGAAGANVLGRLYSLRLNRLNPVGPAHLEVLYNADQVVAAGGDIALSPDNIAVSGKHLMIQEDGTGDSRLVMTSKKRDGSIWRFDLTGSQSVDISSATRVVELAPPGRALATSVGKGVWETSGIIDTNRLFGSGSWLFDVQAHSPTPAPRINTVEDGQLLLLRPVGSHRGDKSDEERRDDEDWKEVR
jgi:Bacterial protein of unknown function (DUF839)